MVAKGEKLYIKFQYVDPDTHQLVTVSRNVLTPDGKLMLNFIRSLIKYRQIAHVDPKIGYLLQVRIANLRAKLEQCPSTISLEKTIMHKLDRAENMFFALFGFQPDGFSGS